MLNVTLRYVLITIVAVCVCVCVCLCVCVCSLVYPAHSAHAPYCIVVFVRFYGIFFTLSHNRHDFRKEVVEHKTCVLILSTIFAYFVFLVIQRDTVM